MAVSTPAVAAPSDVHAAPSRPSGVDFGVPATSPDLVVDGYGDGAGYHVQVAAARSAYTWREVAILHPAGMDDRDWYGYQCISGDGRYAAVAVLPATVVNVAAARDHGAFAYSVDLTTGTVRPISAGVGLKYHSPGCGPAHTAVFTSNPGADESTTTVRTADLATGAISAQSTVPGQLTSAVPAASGVFGVLGTRIVKVAGARTSTVAAVPSAGAAYDLRPTTDGNVDFVAQPGGEAPTADAWRLTGTKLTKVATGPAGRLRLFPGRAGKPVLSGAASVQDATGVVQAPDAGLPDAPAAASLDGHVLLGDPNGGPTATDPLMLATASGKLVTRTHAVSTQTATTAVPDVSSGPGKVAAKAAAVQTPTCGVPRLDPARQALQPNSAQVDWAAQLAAQGALNGSFSRPAGYANMGLAAYSPSNDFSRHVLKHPASGTWDTVPRSIEEAILAQESNFNQASWHELPGVAGDPLIASYYGVVDSITQINYANADCGYGVAQVTSGMALADTSISPNGKAKVAVDYAENIAAGLQILQDKWNQLYDAGIIANGGDPRYLENWYFAVWAYNTGLQPSAKFGNTTGCVPSPTCVGPDGTWGLGWSNNPMNPDYPPTRHPYLKDSYADAAHPSQWPYQERILGWTASPLFRFGAYAYARPTYHGGAGWVNVPDRKLFCTADNRCDSTGAANANFCTLADFECWWHQPVNWVTCTSACATSDFTLGAGSPEPATVNPHPPTCSLDTSKVPTTSTGAPIIVDDQPSPPVNRAGCGSSNWSSNGTFTYAYGTNAAGDPIGQIDTHQAGVGFGGHIRFTHTEDGSNPDLINTGTWTPNLPKLQYYKVKIHIPATGASATNVIYTINPGGGVSPWKIRVNQHWNSEQWVTIGTFAMQNGGTVKLSNVSPSVGHGNVDYSNYDVAFDAIAFVQMGGSPGHPIGGPPRVIDAPKGSNPAWVQCGCVRRTAGDPVDTSTGYYGDTWHDLSVPGRGKALDFSRTYVSALADPAGPNGSAVINGAFGYGWTYSYNLSAVTDPATGNVAILQEDGSQVPFLLADGIYAPAAPRYDATLTKSGTTYTYTRRGTDIYTFDTATGRLTAETDLPGLRAGYWTTLAYDAAGHLGRVTEPAGRKLTVTWTGTHITGLSDTAGRQVTYAYDSAGNLSDVLGAGTTRTPAVQDNDRRQYGYTPTHLLNSMRNPTAFGITTTPAPVVSMVYDSAERVHSQTDQLGHTTTFTYGPDTAAGLVAGQTQVTDPAGHKKLDTYQDGLLTSETINAATTSYTYDPVTLGVSVKSDPNGNTTSYTYDDHGRPVSETDGLGRTTAHAYNDLGQLIETISPVGLATVYNYDEAGHIKTSTGTNDGTVVYGLPTSAVTQPQSQDSEIPDGNPPTAITRTTATYYDDAAHPADLSRTVDGRGNTTSQTFDAFGDLASITDPLNHTTKFGYDTATGRRTTTVSPTGVAAGVNPGCAPPAKGCTLTAYDAWGNVIRTTDPLGHSTAAVFDADGHRTSSTDGNNKTTLYSYDRAGQPTVTTRADTTTLVTHYYDDGTVKDTVDGAGNTTTYGYDNAGRETTRTDPAHRTTTTAYDPGGRRHTVTDPDHRVTTYGYDAADANTSVTSSDADTAAISYTYDAGARRDTMTDATGTSTWTYDSFGEVLNQTDGAGVAVAYGYDAEGNQTTVVYPGATGRTVVRDFDKAGRFDALTDWNTATIRFGYDADDNLSGTTYPNGTTVTDGRDDAGQLTSLTLARGTTTLATLSYPRDPSGRIATDTPTGVPGSAQTYGYTDLEQVHSAGTTAFAYDRADEPTTVGGSTQTFDAAGQLCWSTTATPPASPSCASPPGGSAAYTYDGEGSRKSGPSATYSYDTAGQLTGLTKAGVTASYKYDGTGLRAAKTVAGATTHYVWDGNRTLLSDGGVSYLYGPTGALVEQIGASATQWAFTDNLGSTRALLDATGTVTGAYAYSTYGLTTAHTGTATTPLQFAGQYTDTESGLIYLRARYYDPATAQFLTVDPEVRSTLSPYGYADDDPVNATDPTGLWTGGLCLNYLMGGLVYFGAQGCVVFDGHGDLGVTGTIGGGGSVPTISLTGGLQGSNADKISDLNGPFWTAGGSVDALASGGCGASWGKDSKGRSVYVGEVSAGAGADLPLPIPAEVHGGKTNTWSASFNVPKLAKKIWNWLT